MQAPAATISFRLPVFSESGRNRLKIRNVRNLHRYASILYELSFNEWIVTLFNPDNQATILPILNLKGRWIKSDSSRSRANW